MKKASDYWIECVACTLDDHGVEATQEQIEAIAYDVQGAHEVHGDYSYRPENPMVDEIKQLESKLKAERDKVACQECGGRGRIITNFGVGMQSNTGCTRCHGDGKHAPR